MYRYIIPSLALLFLSSCSTRKVKETHLAQTTVTEKDILISQTNQSYSDASILGPGGFLIRETNPLQSFEEEVSNLDGVSLDEATGRLIIRQNILFAFNSSKVKESAVKTLSDIVTAFNKLDNAYLRIYGHADNVGTESYNKALSKRRAEAVASILIELGVSEDHIETIPEGELSPIASNSNEEGRAKNRRVEFKVVQ